jgi:hypothetical protein
MTGNALAARTPRCVMGVRFERRRVGTILGMRPMTGRADFLDRLDQHRVVLRTVWVMAADAGHAAGVHEALHEVIALHPVLVRGAIGEVRK